MTAAAGSRLDELTNERLLKQNVIMNLAGWALPAAAAIFSIPILTRGLGPSRFGLMAITWAAVGAFSLFDFGLGRALTRLVAEHLAANEDHEIAELVWSATWLLLGVTVVFALVGVVAAPMIVDRFMHVPADLRDETIAVVRMIAIGIPPLAHGVTLRGVLEASQRFRLINVLRVPLGLVTYAGPILAVPFGGDMRIAVGIVLAGRIVYWLAHFFVLDGVVPGLSKPERPTRAGMRELAHVGGWITVSNIVSPIIVQADRVAIAMMFPIAASGWYGTASELATKQGLFTAALLPVLYSALSAAIKPAPERAAELFEKGARVTLLVVFPVTLLLVLFAEPGLKLWLGPAYAPESATVLRWLAIAVYFNLLGQLPYAVLQGGADAKAPGVLHLVELPLYLGILVVLARTWGVRGIAIAWFVRMAVDTVALCWLLDLQFPAARPAVRRTALLASGCVAILALAAILGARIW